MTHRKLSAGLVLAVLLTIALGVSASAQNWQGGLAFQLGFPTGEYKDQIDKTGVGIGGDILWSPRSAPVGIGLSIGWFQVGNETRQEPFSTTIPDVTVDVETENALAQFLLLFRLQPKAGAFRPYADALVGVNYLYTTTTIKNASNDEEVASSTNFDDNALAYGFGGGAMIRVYESPEAGPTGPFEVFVDLGFRYMLGGEAEYLKEGSIRRENAVVAFDVTESKTDIAVARVGVSVSF
ncbi:outer membrane beta-barrel protein [candidate division GN15 bacterium]|nr:outer membrane beta-barrel protein [candidate division GN15 bacterium]